MAHRVAGCSRIEASEWQKAQVPIGRPTENGSSSRASAKFSKQSSAARAAVRDLQSLVAMLAREIDQLGFTRGR